ncbi:MAG: type II toxin-antitoxin system RelE/ParE family toxin [Propionibacteriaceae bacterium]|nr:type II toxin-antitoxin system RelE/ParE family toxin [Propionibacteriaceae bacterium]
MTREWTVRLRPEAQADIAEVIMWYRREAPEQVPRFRNELADALETIRLQPHLFPKRVGTARHYSMRVFPYGIWYVPDEQSRVVHVLAVLHSRRNPSMIHDRVPTENNLGARLTR